MNVMIDLLLRLIALIRKEFLVVLKDPRSRISLFVPPIMQCLIFGYAASYDLNNIPYAVLDQDHSVASQRLLAKFDGSGIFQRVANLTQTEAIASVINNKQALLVIQIGQHFERELSAGRTVPVQLIVDGRNSNTAGTASGYVGSVVAAFNAEWQAEHAGGKSPVRSVSRAWFNPNLETRWFMIPGMIATLTLLQTLILTAMSVAREREQGTFDQLLVTPFGPTEIMIGKAIAPIIIGLIQAIGVLLVAQLWFKIPFAGSFFTLFLCLGLFLFAVIGIGLLVSSISATMQQAMLYSFVLLIPFILLSGLMTPISTMPYGFQVSTVINPLRYAIHSVQRVYLEGAGIELLIPDLWPLLLMGLVTLPAAAWMFRHRFA